MAIRRLLWCCVWCCLLAPQALAQEQWSLGVTAHYGLLLDRYKDLLNYPAGGVLTVRYAPSPQVRLGANAGFYYATAKDEKRIRGGAFLPLTLLAELHGGSGRLRPYGGLELGLYHISAREMDVNDNSDESHFGFGLTGGLNYALGATMDAQVALRYNSVLMNAPSTKLLTLGAGLVFYFGERPRKLWASR